MTKSATTRNKTPTHRVSFLNFDLGLALVLDIAMRRRLYRPEDRLAVSLSAWYSPMARPARFVARNSVQESRPMGGRAG